MLNLIVARIRVLAKEGDRREKESRRAEPALHRASLRKRPLHWMELSVLRQALDRRDARSVDLCSEDEASIHRSPIEKDRACAALPFAAPLFDALCIELISEKVDQTKAGIDIA